MPGDMASGLNEAISLKRYNYATKTWQDAGTLIPAAAESQGDATYRFRIRYRPELRSKKDLEPAMRVIFHTSNGDETLDLADVIMADPRIETHLIASHRIIEPFEDLESGTKGLRAWPEQAP